MRFHDFQPALCPEILAETDALGFDHMTPVQAATLPLFLSNKDVCVDACTGSGKTLAFVLPIVQLLKSKLADGSITAPRHSNVTNLVAMVISPTRELARQIFECAEKFVARALPSVQLLLFVGGTSVDEDLSLIRGAVGKCSVVIGTPGRTEDLLNRCVGSSVETREFEMLILDEADTLLDMGFEVSLNKILEHLPKQRRTGLFSATQTQEVKALARAGLRNPATISVQVANNTQVTPSTLENYYCLVGHDQRLSALHHFVLSKKELFKGQKDIPVVALHGKMPQKKRTTNYDLFSSLKSGLLVCTDVVARGIDLPDVDWIVQYDPPQDPNFFVHRVGRTARAGRSGCALSFLSSNEDAYVNFLKIRKVPSEEMTLPLDTMEDVLPKVKSFILEDRDLLEKGTKAFMAFVRSYKEHQCQFIFRFKELDLGAVARGFCLLQLPKINELRNVRINFEKAGIKTMDIKFKDKAREKERQKKLVAIAKENEEREKKDAEMREKKRKRPLEEDNQKHPRRREKKKGMHQQIVEEWDELAEEQQLYKKMKKGKITEEEYEKALLGKADDSDDDDDSDNEGGDKKKPKWQRAEEKLKERFKKKEQVVKKTGEQKREAAKREERIRKRKKSQHVQRAQQRAQRRARR
ncbi:ATP-dependent RNA helicase [Phytophthora fragariae]|uniref:ATP-dependent RNA helicase n=1 Tax=Phytophthora fragariae TaxID=53985 RepID=A0A6G0LW59_9STRA|nr:ATP-dependent RNA helicase [Phytophthora fragariae]